MVRAGSRLLLFVGVAVWLAGSVPAQDAAFLRGDADVDGALALGDAIHIVGFLFRDDPAQLACFDAADANDDGTLDVSDPVAVLLGLFAGLALPEPHEACGADPNIDSLDCVTHESCNPPPDVFRITSLQLRDPHAFVGIILLGCFDVTETAPLGIDGFNGQLNKALVDDLDGDDLLDLSFLMIFRPLNQEPTGGGEMTARYGNCTAPLDDTHCRPAGEPGSGVYSNRASGLCLEPLPDTVTPGRYVPAVPITTGPCFVMSMPRFDLDFGVASVPLYGVDIAAGFMGDPAQSLTSGLLKGFVSEADADATIIDKSFPFIGGKPLSSVLPGGKGNCAPHSDKDVGPSAAGDEVPGWWVYFELEAERVSYSEP